MPKEKQVELHLVWNADGDVVADQWPDGAEKRHAKEYGGEIIGRKTITVTVDVPTVWETFPHLRPVPIED